MNVAMELALLKSLDVSHPKTANFVGSSMSGPSGYVPEGPVVNSGVID
jgi:hypothetical protein